MWVHDLRDADDRCGGKAVGLARLLAAGLPVPPGFVIDDGAFKSVAGELAVDDPAAIGHVLGAAAERIAAASLPDDLVREVRERAEELGELLIVRSSATIEDAAAGSAAGVFSSRGAVRIDEIWDAIRAVWTSALTPLAAAYARRRGGTIAIGVIVQAHVAGTPIVVYTRPPGHPTARELLVQRADHVARHSRDDLPPEVEAQHAALIALRAEQAIAATEGADVELVQIRKQHGVDVAIETTIVQARPIVHPVARELSPPPPTVLAALADGRTWTWDLAHNPDPLSPAQQGLIERVERAGIAPWSLRVCAGYLYTASRGEPLPEIGDAAAVVAQAGELEAQLEKILAGDLTLSPAEAIERYLAFYATWARELAPLITAARGALPAALRAAGHERADALTAALASHRESAVETTLLAAARGELDEDEVVRTLGVLAPAWDVAVPTFGERPGLIQDSIARARVALAKLAPAATDHLQRLAEEHVREVALARAAADLAERDDRLFARAQHMVRKALLARADELRLAGDDVFWLPLDETSSSAPIDPVDARRRAAGARAAAERTTRWRMPVVVGDIPPAGPPLRGLGTGPRVAGRVVRFASLASAIAVGSGDVIVTRAVTPALAVLVAGCAALVSETGGLLDHGAALARELGVPCVVGCRDAWTLLTDGMLVTVDGESGTVTPSPT